MVYGYCRISTRRQSIERQVRNIQAAYPDAVICQEIYTGTKFQGRDELKKILAVAKGGDTIVFDSVSRMSRNAEEGIQLYFELYNRGINLVFLKESYINSDTYKSAIQNQVSLTGEEIDVILEGVNRYLRKLAEKQIRLAFQQAEKEVADLHQRTREGLVTARMNGKRLGGVPGKKLTTKKSIVAKREIRRLSKDFDGNLADIDVINRLKLAKNTYYRYKKQIRDEISLD